MFGIAKDWFIHRGDSSSSRVVTFMPKRLNYFLYFRVWNRVCFNYNVGTVCVCARALACVFVSARVFVHIVVYDFCIS